MLFLTKKDKFIIVLNSFFAFISAFLLVKGILAIFRFLLLKSFNSPAQMINFEIVSVTHPYSSIWTHFGLITIHSSEFIISLGIAIVAYYFYRYYRSFAGLTKLWFSWIYVVAIVQSVGLFVRDVPLKREFYHSLNWSGMPDWLILSLTIASAISLVILSANNEIKFLRNATSFNHISTNFSRSLFFSYIAIFPVFLGVFFLLLIQINSLKLHALIEFSVLILTVLIPFFRFFSKGSVSAFRIVKDEPTNKLNTPLIVLLVLSLATYFIFRYTFY